VTNLWGLFIDEIATGSPVFFCFSQESLRGHLPPSAEHGDSPLELICDAARGCFSIVGNSVLLTPDALAPLSCGRSMAVVLICQQILAVEDMARDRRGFSENAYFPRLRSLMSPELLLISQNPYSFGDFSEIWKVFAKEIKKCAGATSATITFKFGTYTGVNRARQFPLSQALLSRADLAEVFLHGRSSSLKSDNPERIWREIYRVRTQLSRRAQRLVAEGFLREEIIEQVSSFANHITESGHSTNLQPVSAAILELCIALDSSDFLNEEYRAFVQVRDTSVPVNDDALVERKLSSILPDHGYVACVLSETSDYWTLYERDALVGSGDSLLIVARGNGMQRAHAMLEGLCATDAFSEGHIRPLGRSKDFQVCEVEILRGSPNLNVRSGRILERVNAETRTISYQWVGGVCIDGRSRKYLRQALPQSVKFGLVNFQLQELIGVGMRRMDWGGFSQLIEDLENDAKYDLHFPGGMVAQLSIAVSTRLALERVGFVSRNGGSFSPGLQSVSTSDCAIVGFREPQPTVQPLTAIEVADLIRRVRKNRNAEFSDVGVLRMRVKATSMPDAVKRVIASILKTC
jgi:hypothetical protein